MTIGSWQPLIEGMLEAVWIVDPLDLRIVAANRAAAGLLGAGFLVERDGLGGVDLGAEGGDALAVDQHPTALDIDIGLAARTQSALRHQF